MAVRLQFLIIKKEKKEKNLLLRSEESSYGQTRYFYILELTKRKNHVLQTSHVAFYKSFIHHRSDFILINACIVSLNN